MKKYVPIFIVIIICLAACNKPRDFFADQDDPGLSRFTSRGYDIMTAYIDDTAYINPYDNALFGGANSNVEIYKIHTSSTFDTLSISWSMEYSDSTYGFYSPYNSIALLLPIPKSFDANDFLNWKGKRFPIDTTSSVAIQLNGYYGYGSYYGQNNLTGTASIYFVEIDPVNDNSTPQKFSFSGLFEGNIGNNIHITKGRFDFYIDPSSLNN